MRFLFFLCIIIPLSTYCQSSGSCKKKSFSIGLSVSPDYTFRTLKANTSNQWLADSRNDIEIPKIGYTVGLKLHSGLNKRFSFEAGLLFSDKGERTKKTDLNFAQSKQALPVESFMIIHYYYLDVPLKVKYYFLAIRNGGFFVSAGISPNLFLTLKSTSIVEYDDGHIKKNHSYGGNLSRINLSFTAGLGFQTDISKALYLSIEPTYRRSITSIIDAELKSYLFSAGLDLGLFYRF
jgi:opacity protein-like surface antigen